MGRGRGNVQCCLETGQYEHVPWALILIVFRFIKCSNIVISAFDIFYEIYYSVLCTDVNSCVFFLAALGIDSRLEFSSVNPIQFVLMKSKSFPELRAFTIGLWLKVYRPMKPGTVLSYRQASPYVPLV